MGNLFSLDGPYARVMNWLWNMLVISVLWVVCCIPVFTIGAASTAAYYAAAKAVRHRTGKVASEFFSSFRSNFRQATLLTFLVGPVLALLVLECMYLYSDAGVGLGVLYLFYFMTLTVLGLCIYLWACLSRFSRGSFALIRMSAVLTFRHLLTTVLLLLLLAAVLAGIFLMPWGILLFPGIGVYLETFLMEKILLSLSPKVSPDDLESQKWYYQ